MHNIKDLRNNLDTFKKKFKDRNLDFDINAFNKLDYLNRKLISDKEKLEQEKKTLSKSKDKSNFEKSKKISEQISILVKNQNDTQNELNKIICFFVISSISLDKFFDFSKFAESFNLDNNFFSCSFISFF